VFIAGVAHWQSAALNSLGPLRVIEVEKNWVNSGNIPRYGTIPSQAGRDIDFPEGVETSK